MPSKKITKELPRNNPLRSAREKKQNRVIVIGFIITAILIVALSGYALIYEFLIKNRIPVATVNGVEIDNTYFQERVRLERYAYIQQYQSLNAQYQFFADDPETSQYFVSQLLQMRQALGDYNLFGETVLNTVIDDELIAQQAQELGLTVTEQEVQETIRQILGYFPEGTPTPLPVATSAPTPTLSRTQEALLGSPPLVEAEGEQPQLEMDVNEEEAEIGETGAEPTLTPQEDAELPEENLQATPTTAEPQPTQTAIATATPYTEVLFQENYQTYIDDIKFAGVSEASLRNYIYHFLLTQKVRTEVVKDVPNLVEQVWARHILVNSHEEAIIVRTRLDRGEDWAEIAAEVSLDTSNKDQGGDLGWFPRGRMVAPFEDVAFQLEVGEISEPVETQFGWHTIQIIGHDTLPLSSLDYQNTQETYYQEWFSKIKEESQININDVWKDLVPTQPALPF